MTKFILAESGKNVKAGFSGYWATGWIAAEEKATLWKDSAATKRVRDDSKESAANTKKHSNNKESVANTKKA